MHTLAMTMVKFSVCLLVPWLDRHLLGRPLLHIILLATEKGRDKLLVPQQICMLFHKYVILLSAHLPYRKYWEHILATVWTSPQLYSVNPMSKTINVLFNIKYQNSFIMEGCYLLLQR